MIRDLISGSVLACVVLSLVMAPSGAVGGPGGSRVVHGQLATELVPGVATYEFLLPPGYGELAEPIPLMLMLHGGSSGVGQLERRMRPHIERAWSDGVLSPVVVVTPITGDSFNIDWTDGEHNWETFILTELIPHVRKTYRVIQSRDGTVITGVSAGGQGTLRIGLRNPESFIAAAAMEPGVPPAISFEDVDLEFTDLTNTAPGDYYYVRVNQLDGGRAWSSPFWVGAEPTRS